MSAPAGERQWVLDNGYTQVIHHEFVTVARAVVTGKLRPGATLTAVSPGSVGARVDGPVRALLEACPPPPIPGARGGSGNDGYADYASAMRSWRREVTGLLAQQLDAAR